MSDDRGPFSARNIILRGFSRHLRAILGGTALRSIHQTAELGVPVLIGVVVDRAIVTGSFTQLWVWLVVLGVDFLVLSFSWRAGARLEFNAMQEEMHLLRCEIADHVLDERGADTEHLPGELLSVATSDAERCAHSIWAFGWMTTGITAIGITAVLLISMDLRIGLLAFIGLPAALGAIQLLSPVVSRRSRTEQDKIGKVAALASDLVRGLRPLRGIGAEKQAVRRYRELSQDATIARIGTASSFGYLFGASSLVGGLFLAAVAGLAGSDVANGHLRIGQLIAIVGVTQFLSEPIALIGEATAEFGRARASAHRIADVLNSPRLLTLGSREPTSHEGHLVVQDLYLDDLKGLSFETRPGEVLALVVADATVSDALMDVLSGEVSPASGSVLLDGVPLQEMSIGAMHERLLVNRHHVDLFEGTLRSNIVVGPGDLDAVLHATAAADVAELDPLGLDQQVTDRGFTFSGGQRQRVALARSLITDVPTLVLQEPTTAVDAITEQIIAEGIRDVRHRHSERATIILTSSPSLLHHADRVLFVVDGTIATEGVHTELMRQSPAYRDAVLR